MTMFCMVLEEYFQFSIDISFSFVHDLGEAYDGDISAKIEVNSEIKLKKENDPLDGLTAPISKEYRQKFFGFKFICGSLKLHLKPSQQNHYIFFANLKA